MLANARSYATTSHTLSSHISQRCHRCVSKQSTAEKPPAAAKQHKACLSRQRRPRPPKKTSRCWKIHLREAPFVPDEGPGDSLLALPGGTRSRGVSPGAFAAIKAALEQCAEEVGADFGPEERQWINRIRDGALRRLEPDVAAARREAKRRLLAELAQEAAEERAKLAELRLQTARARDEVAACRAVAAARIMARRHRGRPCRRSRRRRSRLSMDCDAVEKASTVRRACRGSAI